MWHIETIEYYSALQKNEIMPFAATWMKRDFILSEVESARERQILYDTAYMWNLSHGTREPMHRIETDSQTWRTGLRLPRGRGRDGRGIWIW